MNECFSEVTLGGQSLPLGSLTTGPARSPLVSGSPAMRHAIQLAEHVAPTTATVLLLGETGVGKEVFAQAIHDRSPRGSRPMVRVSCAAIPGTLIESELFGRERGAYTDAHTRQAGRFEAAHRSTIFLDEIGELSAEGQVKLLRVLQERVVERLGSSQPIKIDVRVVAATNRNLERAVSEGTFREDLFYRLNVFPVVVPPLRDRLEDLPALVWTFVEELSRSFGKTVTSVSESSLDRLCEYDWPGNVRELRNVVERALIAASGPTLSLTVPHRPMQLKRAAETLEDLKRPPHLRRAGEQELAGPRSRRRSRSPRREADDPR